MIFNYQSPKNKIWNHTPNILPRIPLFTVNFRQKNFLLVFIVSAFLIFHNHLLIISYPSSILFSIFLFLVLEIHRFNLTFFLKCLQLFYSNNRIKEFLYVRFLSIVSSISIPHQKSILIHQRIWN